MKEIRGFFYLNKEQNAQTSTTLKLLFLNRIQLLRMRVREMKPVEKKGESDSIQNASGAAEGKSEK